MGYFDERSEWRLIDSVKEDIMGCAVEKDWVVAEVEEGVGLEVGVQKSLSKMMPSMRLIAFGRGRGKSRKELER